MTATTETEIRFHPLRATLYDELHTRPFFAVATPQQYSYLAISAHPQEQDLAFEQICQLCRQYGVEEPASRSTGFRKKFGAFTLKWERHAEFFTISVIKPDPPADNPFAEPAIRLLPTEWLSHLPGEVVAAFHLAVVDADYPATEADLTRYFEGYRFSLSRTRQDKAVLYNAFRLHSDGFGRLLVRNQGMSDAQTGRLIRRLIEVETYRLFALMPLPLAKQLMPQLAEMDRSLANYLNELSKLAPDQDERKLLQELSKVEARLETWRTQTNRRFSAARAYHEMLLERLERIGEVKLEGYTTLGEFMRRRLDPALRTCTSVHTWMDDLSQRIKRASDLLRTRANLTLQEQNRSLLAAMNRRSRIQFRLQETVEGLSVVAISYYLVGLISYLLTGLPLDEWGMSKTVLVAVAVPLVLGYVIWITRRIKHRLIKEPLQDDLPPPTGPAP